MPESSPIARGGGGDTFEKAAGAVLLTRLLCGETFIFSTAAVTRVRFQTSDVASWDDIAVTARTPAGTTQVAYCQSRRNPRFSASDLGFRKLITGALQDVEAHRSEYEAENRRLVLITLESSTSVRTLRELTRLAYDADQVDTFLPAVEQSDQRIRAYFDEVNRAVSAERGEFGSKERAWQILRVVRVVSWELDNESSRDVRTTVEALTRLDDEHQRDFAVALFARLRATAADLAMSAGAVDRSKLIRRLGHEVGQRLGQAGDRRQNRLDELERESRARSMWRFESLGVPTEVAAELIESPVLGSPPEELLPVPPGSLHLLVGEMGSGKSTIAERAHLMDIDVARGTDDSPAPVFIRANGELVLEPAIREQCRGLGDPSQTGVRLILDGLDETSLDEAARLVREATVLMRAWPSSSVLATSRPLAQLTIVGRTVAVQPFAEDRAAELFAQVSGGETVQFRAISLSKEMSEALRLPLFLLLFAVERRSDRRLSRRPAQLLSHLVERAITGSEDRTGHQALRRLAVAAVDAGNTAVSLTEIGASAADRHFIANTRLVAIDERGRCTFPVVAIAQWLAGQDLRDRPERIDEIRRDTRRVDRWRYAIALAVAEASHDQATRLLDGLTREDPALSSLISRAAISGPPMGESTESPPAWPECGGRMVDALDAWVEGLQQLAPRVLPTRADGRLKTVGARVHENLVTLGWWSGPDRDDRVLELPRNVHPLSRDREQNWRPWRSGSVGLQASWAWEIAQTAVADQVKKIVETHDLPPPTEALQAEADWEFAQRVVGRHPSEIFDAAIRLTDIHAAIDRIRNSPIAAQRPHATVVSADSGGGTWSLNDADTMTTRLMSASLEVVECPWPGPDWPLPDAGTTWEFWSPKRLIERLTATTTAALEAYAALCAQWFPRFLPRLGTYASLPVHLVGIVTPAAGRGLEAHPRIEWILEPSADGLNRAVWRLEPDMKNDPLMETVRDRAASADVPSCFLTVHAGDADVFDVTPATALVYTLLARDLEEWGIGKMASSTL